MHFRQTDDKTVVCFFALPLKQTIPWNGFVSIKIVQNVHKTIPRNGFVNPKVENTNLHKTIPWNGFVNITVENPEFDVETNFNICLRPHFKLK